MYKEEDEKKPTTTTTAIDKEDAYIMAVHDMCARIDLAVSEMISGTSEIMVAITNLNNTRKHYLKLIGRMRQESISSK